MVYTVGQKTGSSVEPGSLAHGQLSRWLDDNKDGWSDYMATPPGTGTLVDVPGFKLQLLEQVVILHTPQGLLSKQTNTRELTLLLLPQAATNSMTGPLPR